MERADAVDILLKTNEELRSLQSRVRQMEDDEKGIRRYTRAYRPTDTIEGFRVAMGISDVMGATPYPGFVNFTVASVGATSCSLVLFHRKQSQPFAVIPFPDRFRTGSVYSMMVFDLDIRAVEYCYRMDGPYDPSRGLLFDKDRNLLDPYARAVVGQRGWGHSRKDGGYHARVVETSHMWDRAVQPIYSMEDSIIYEMHVRGFTMHPSSNVMFPGTFAGIIEKIPYLKSLGITAVELMPIFEFDETHEKREYNGRRMLDYWGYNTVSFYAPNTSYAASAEYNEEGMELKKMVRLLNENGIEVILDVVFNHTAEGDEKGPVFSFKGIDNNIYYMLDRDGRYYNFSGCGNTVNCNNSIVQDFIISCLRYWVTEYHISGFRFDLASIMSRGEHGVPLQDPPLLERIAHDPILADTKLIAEAWDAGGMYQVGTFPAYQKWAEWNGRYRDAIRGYLKGDLWNAPEAARRITGSDDLYHGSYLGYTSSINFITCHDGFTLNDLYSYNDKHNLDNGWNNTDGTSDNRSWNCGEEGETRDPKIVALRFKMMRNAITVLMMSRGTPMILAGDEFGNSQRGNNNCYCQDNELSWLDWGDTEQNREFYEFYKNVIAFRKAHPVIRHTLRPGELGLPSIQSSTEDPDDVNITDHSETICILFSGNLQGYGESSDAADAMPDPAACPDDIVYLAVHAGWSDAQIRLPALPEGWAWGKCIDTDPSDSIYCPEEPYYMESALFYMKPRSCAVFVVVPKR